jgi:hypothetical protein
MSQHVIPELDAKGLRQFGLSTGAIVAVLFGLIFPYLFERAWPLWPWAIFAVLGLWGIIAPVTLGPVYRGWMRLGLLISKVTTPIIMTLVFIVAILPMALILKLFRRDFMRRKFDTSESYRVKSTPPSPENMEKPY